MAGKHQMPGMMEPGEEKMLEDFSRRPRNRLSGVRFSNIGSMTDEIDFAEALLECIRNLPQLLKHKQQMDDEHDKIIVAASNAPDESLQPIINVVLNDKNVINAIFDVNNKYDQIQFIFNCIYALLPFVTDNEFIDDVSHLSNILSNQTTEFTRLNVQLLLVLFNMVPRELLTKDGNSNLRAFLMHEILELINRSKSVDLAKQWQPRLKELIKWIKDCKLNNQQKRQLYYSASQVAGTADNEELEQQLLLQFLKSWDKNDKVSDLTMQLAAKAIIQTIKNDEINTRVVKQLTKSEVVELMSNSKENSILCELLRIVYSGSVLDYLKFCETNDKYLESVGINYDNLLHKMRILTLCSLGSKTKLISFTKLKKELSIETTEDIENIVIDGIKRKLVEARIDHLHTQVIINRTALRVFDKQTWDEIAAKLALWRENTESVKSTISGAGLTRFFESVVAGGGMGQ